MNGQEVFKDRVEAGQKLAEQFQSYATQQPFIIALPRGGVPVGFQIAKDLQAPLDVIVARKIGHPYQPEYGIGALAEGDVIMLDNEVIAAMHIPKEEIEAVITKEKKELQRRVEWYRQGQPLPELSQQTVILVDDGLATGVTARAAITALHNLHPQKIIFALPTCASDTATHLQTMVDSLVCLIKPSMFMAVGIWYEQFEQTSDQEVVELLTAAKHFKPL